MPSYAPLIMIGGFLLFGLVFVIMSDVTDWIERRKMQKNQ